MRKEILRFSAVAVIIGSAAFSGCRNESQDLTVNVTPGIARTLSPESPKAQWESLPATQRLQRLINKDYPSFDGFDRQKETTVSTAQTYCEQTKCNFYPDEQAKSVHYVNQNEFIKKLSEEEGRIFTKEETEAEKKSRLAITTSAGEIYINHKLLQDIILDTNKNQPQIINQINGKDFETLFEISVQAHELTHGNSKKQTIHFDGFSIKMPNKEGPINFDTLNKFTIEGRDINNEPQFISGGDEAITDFAAYIIIERKMGLKYFSPPEYRQGALLIEKLNKMANISDEEFLNYANGKLSSEELLKKWGSFRRNESTTDLKAGILALRDVGAAVQGILRFQDAESDIKRMLRFENP